jgi:hypothetical protein
VATVQAIVQEGWREILARVYARDVADVQAEITHFKIGEGGFIDLPPKTPITPDPTFRDLQSEGTPLAGGGFCEFTNGSAAVIGSGTTFLADVAVGDWIKPGPLPSAFVNAAGQPGSEEDGWGQVLFVNTNNSITLVAPYVGGTHLLAEARRCHKAAEPLFTFRKAMANSDVLFTSGVPAITEVTAIVLAAEASADQLGNNPQFFELGLFDANNVMLVYMTFPDETKTLVIQLNHIIELVW